MNMTWCRYETHPTFMVRDLWTKEIDMGYIGGCNC